MSWKVEVKEVTHVKEHPNADKLELLYLNRWQLVVPKGQYSVGDLVVYFPADSIIPDRWLEEWGLTGKLSGSQHNRVKPIRLRQEQSIGLVCHAPNGYSVGDDMSDYYGIVRWEMPVPIQLSGKITSRPNTFIKYDIDNINNYSNPFSDGELVVITEKVHGTNCALYLTPDEYFGVCSRNYGLQEEGSNTYWRTVRIQLLEEKLRLIRKSCIINNIGKEDDYYWLHGEIIGVQDLKYGLVGELTTFLAFDIRVNNKFLNYNDFVIFCDGASVDCVPFLYEGTYKEDLLNMRHGNEMVSGKEMHIREGIVIKPMTETLLPNGERKILKCVSEDYLFRKGGTEHH